VDSLAKIASDELYEETTCVV